MKFAERQTCSGHFLFHKLLGPRPPPPPPPHNTPSKHRPGQGPSPRGPIRTHPLPLPVPGLYGAAQDGDWLGTNWTWIVIIALAVLVLLCLVLLLALLLWGRRPQRRAGAQRRWAEDDVETAPPKSVPHASAPAGLRTQEEPKGTDDMCRSRAPPPPPPTHPSPPQGPRPPRRVGAVSVKWWATRERHVVSSNPGNYGHKQYVAPSPCAVCSAEGHFAGPTRSGAPPNWH